MSSVWIAFAAGVFIGVPLGVFIAALCIAAGRGSNANKADQS